MEICGGRAFYTEGKEDSASAKALGQECTGHVQSRSSMCPEQYEPGEKGAGGWGWNEDREVGEGQAHSLSSLSSLS